MEANNSENDGNNKPTRSNRDEIWKEQIRLAIEESQRNIEQQQAVQQAPGYRITLNAPHATKSYYDKIRTDHIIKIRQGHTKTKHPTKSESEISKKRGQPGTKDRFQSRTPNEPNVASTKSTSTKYSAWPKSDKSAAAPAAHHKKRKTKRFGDRSPSEDTFKSETGGAADKVTASGQIPSAVESSAGDMGDVLSYFDPNYVKPEFQEILAKSRNVVIGPPREILRAFFGYTDDDQIPDELRHDDSPKAFILPRKLWKDYDDGTITAAAHSTAQSSSKMHTKGHDESSMYLLDKRILRRMEEEKQVEPYVPRQPKNFAVDYLARKPFKKFGMISSNLNDASPNMMEHLELKDVNVDPGGHLRRDHNDRRFKISEVTDTPVKLAPKEGHLKDDRRPWYAEGWAEGTDPKQFEKSPAFTKEGDIEVPHGGSKPGPKGKGRGKPYHSEHDKPDKRRQSGGIGKKRGSSASLRGSVGSSGSDSSGYSCTCGDSGSSSGSSGESGSSSGENVKKRKSKKHSRKSDDEAAEEEPSKKDIAIDAKQDDEIVPPWAPPSWKSPEGYKGWIYKKKDSSQSAPDTSVQFEEDPNSKAPGSDWFRAFGVVKKAEKEGEIEKLRHILGYVEGEDDLRKLEEPELEDQTEEEEEDPMERLPRGDLPAPREYQEFPTPEHFKYYRSYPLYPTLSSERYFEWYKDVDLLANPFGRRRFRRPAGISKSMGHINWNDPKEAAKWYAYGYRRPDTKPKPEREDYNTKDYIYDNARSIMLMPPRKVIPKYIDDRKGTSHLLEPSGLVKKFIFRGDFGKVPDYLVGRNEELGRPLYPDMDKFYRPHRCKYLHGHIHCKICMRAHPTIRSHKIDWQCEMTPRDYEKALQYKNSTIHQSYSPSKSNWNFHRKGDTGYKKDDVEHILNEVGLGDEYRRSKAARGNQNLKTVQSSIISNPVDVIFPPVYV